MEMDEAFVPYTRSDLKLPSKQESTREVYKHAIEDSPLMSLWRLFVMNFFGHRKWTKNNYFTCELTFSRQTRISCKNIPLRFCIQAHGFP